MAPTTTETSPVTTENSNLPQGGSLPNLPAVAMALPKHEAPRSVNKRVEAAKKDVNDADAAMNALSALSLGGETLLERETARQQKAALIQLQQTKDKQAFLAMLIKAAIWARLITCAGFDLVSLRGALIYIMERYNQADGLEFFTRKGRQTTEERRQSRAKPMVFLVNVAEMGAEAREELKSMNFHARSRFHPHELEGRPSIPQIQAFARKFGATVLVAASSGLATFAENGVVDANFVAAVAQPDVEDQDGIDLLAMIEEQPRNNAEDEGFGEEPGQEILSGEQPERASPGSPKAHKFRRAGLSAVVKE